MELAKWPSHENADIRAHEPDLLGAAASIVKELSDPSPGSDNEEKVRNGTSPPIPLRQERSALGRGPDIA